MQVTTLKVLDITLIELNLKLRVVVEALFENDNPLAPVYMEGVSCFDVSQRWGGGGSAAVPLFCFTISFILF